MSEFFANERACEISSILSLQIGRIEAIEPSFSNKLLIPEALEEYILFFSARSPRLSISFPLV